MAWMKKNESSFPIWKEISNRTVSIFNVVQLKDPKITPLHNPLHTKIFLHYLNLFISFDIVAVLYSVILFLIRLACTHLLSKARLTPLHVYFWKTAMLFLYPSIFLPCSQLVKIESGSHLWDQVQKCPPLQLKTLKPKPVFFSKFSRSAKKINALETEK